MILLLLIYIVTESVSDKINFGWCKIPPYGESVEFDMNKSAQLFYVSIKGFIEDKAIKPDTKILVWNGQTLKRQKKLVKIKNIKKPVEPNKVYYILSDK